MTWICGMPECNAVRAGLSEIIVNADELAAMRERIAALEAENDRLRPKRIVKMTEAQQRECGALWCQGMTQRQLAKKYGVSQRTIATVCANARKNGSHFNR